MDLRDEHGSLKCEACLVRLGEQYEAMMDREWEG